jgi:hypothetical protein
VVPLSLVVIAGLTYLVMWLGAGLTKVAKDVRGSADAVRADLTTYRGALKNGDTQTATAALEQARVHLAEARAASDVTEVRVARFVPVVRHAVGDLDHLLRAAGIVITASTDALNMYQEFSNHDTGIFHDSRFDMPSVTRAKVAADRLVADMNHARDELNGVRGGPFEPGVTHMRDAALRQVDQLDATGRAVVGFLRVLPDAVGARVPRKYVIAVMNPAELRFSGGAPLSLALATFDKGKLTISNRGQTNDLTNGNERVVWPAVKGDPWLHSTPTPLATSTISPDWSVSGEELLRAYEAQFHIRADGAIGLDPVALADILRVTGPVDTPGYGQVSADNLVPILIRDAYTTEQNTKVRHTLNNELMDLMIGRLTAGGHLIEKGKALSAAAKGGHFQMYFRNSTMQASTAEAHLAGLLPKRGTDDAGTFTQNRNASKVDFFQHRTVEQVVQINADGSADVTRTITIDNRTQWRPGYDSGIGYATGVSTPRIMTFVPDRAKVTDATLGGSEISLHTPRESGRIALWVDTRIPVGGQAVLVVRYHLPGAAVRHGGVLRYDLSVAAQAMVNPEQLVLQVLAPPGWRVVPSGGDAFGVSRMVDKDVHFAVRFAQK